jgi:hypothetical protein
MRIDNFQDYTQGLVADVDGATTVEISYIDRRVEDNAFILLSSGRADCSANDE